MSRALRRSTISGRHRVIAKCVKIERSVYEYVSRLRRVLGFNRCLVCNEPVRVIRRRKEPLSGERHEELFEFFSRYPVARSLAFCIVKNLEQILRWAALLRQYFSQQKRPLLAHRTLKDRLSRMMLGAPRGIGQDALEIVTVIEKGIVPTPRVFPIARCLHQRDYRAVWHLILPLEEMMEKDGTHVSLQVHLGFSIGENAYSSSRCRAYPRKFEQLCVATGELSGMVICALLSSSFKSKCATMIAHPLPQFENIAGRGCRQSINGRKGTCPTLPVLTHTHHLGLLQHDLAGENQEGIVDAAPRKIPI